MMKNLGHEEAVRRFVDDASFAKIVNTHEGAAILVGGSVINIRSASPMFHAEAIVSALRSQGRGVGEASKQDGLNTLAC